MCDLCVDPCDRLGPEVGKSTLFNVGSRGSRYCTLNSRFVIQYLRSETQKISQTLLSTQNGPSRA